MSGTTISGTYTGGVTLLTNPTTIAATGNVSNTAANGNAVSGPTGTAWTLTNQGLISETASGGIGVSFAQSGTVINASGGTIAAVGDGVLLNGGGAVSNASGGTITGYLGVNAKGAAATVANAGSIGATGATGDGVQVAAGGQVTNQSGGIITGYAGVIGLGAAATVTNAGSIGGNLTANYGTGIWLQTGGAVYNLSGGLITGNYGVAFTEVQATLMNAGTIAGNATNAVHGAGFYSNASGLVTNQSSGVITGFQGVWSNDVALTVENAGVIAGDNTVATTTSGAYTYIRYPGQAAGVLLQAGGVITNQAGGTISGYDGVRAGAAATVVNTGIIAGAVGTGTGGYSNYTFTYSPRLAAGVALDAGGSVTNQSGGTISGYDGVSAAADAVVVNAGVITGETAVSGANASAVYFGDGGSVTNQSGGTIYGNAFGVKIAGALGTVTNLGTILVDANGGSGGVDGVYLADGGIVTNGASGGTVSSAYIFGYHQAVAFGASSTGTLINYGTLRGQGGNGAAVVLTNGVVINGPSGATGAQIYVEGASAIEIYDNASTISTGTVINYGTVYNRFQGSNSGVLLQGAGVVSNLGSSALINGSNYGVYGGHDDTVINAGTIENHYGDGGAVKLGTGTNRVIVDPGAVFIGQVTVGGTSTLELASAASAGTLSGLGTQYAGFSAVAVDAGASWTLASANTVAAGVTLTNAGTLFDAGTLINAGNVAGGGTIVIGRGASVVDTGTVASTETIAFAGTSGVLDLTPAGFSGVIGNFQTGDVISLTGVSNVVSYSVVNGNTLDLVRSDNSHIDLTLNRSITNFTTMVSGSNTIIRTDTVTCFVAGTALATPDGPVAVEALRIGDMVLTASGQGRPVRWIGRRNLDLTRHPKPGTVQPIRVMAGALGDGLPRRDLLVSPDHAMLLDGMLIPARLLRNDVTIRREESWASVTYYHVELETHDVLLAEGAMAESYLDTGNRDMFENAGQSMVLHPDLSSGQSRREAQSCAPFAADAERIEPVWRRLARRAPLLGLTLPEPIETTADPDLRVACGGRSFAPVAIEGSRHVFLLPAWQGVLRLRSRFAAPCDAMPWIEDQRQLGVMVRAMTITDGSEIRTVTVDDPALDAGWWTVEQDGCSLWRWTDGDATVAIESARPCRLEIDVAGTTDYPIPGRQRYQTAGRAAA